MLYKWIINAAYARRFSPVPGQRRHALVYMKKFAPGNSSKCDACRKSVELHDKRHREIAGLILRIRNIDEAEQKIISPANNRKRQTRKSHVSTNFHSISALDNVVEEGDWADSSTLNDGDLEAGALSPLQMKENYTPKRLKKAERKKAKQSKAIQVIMPELMESIDVVLHPENHMHNDKEHRPGDESNAALSNTIIGENIAFNANCFKPSIMRQSVHNKKLLKANDMGKALSPQNAQEDPATTSVLEQLGINSIPGLTFKERNTLVKQLRNAIRDDADKVENEGRDTMMRMAGYWRYVNRKTYNSMVRNNEIWDWVTGQKLDEIEEEEENETAGTEDGCDSDLTSWDDSSTLVAPFSGAGTPVKEVEDNAQDFEPSQARTRKQSREPWYVGLRGGNSMPTPKGSHFPCDASERRGQISEPELKTPSFPPQSQGWPAAMKDDRHLRPTSFSTLKNGEPFKFAPTNPAAPTPSKDVFSGPHNDPNNSYSPLARLNEISQRPARTSKSLKIPPPGVLSARDVNTDWTTVKAKGFGPGKSSYAGAVKKHI
ncbi:MAG: hypothetical protein LQ341_004193 [Variospora aurantia]|nr:MAG: hypothetical protein LQ341_004193 [Variospora aurantia]